MNFLTGWKPLEVNALLDLLDFDKDSITQVYTYVYRDLPKFPGTQVFWAVLIEESPDFYLAPEGTEVEATAYPIRISQGDFPPLVNLKDFVPPVPTYG